MKLLHPLVGGDGGGYEGGSGGGLLLVSVGSAGTDVGLLFGGT